jgi:cytochrome bd-type quinol oxidase subunit 2
VVLIPVILGSTLYNYHMFRGNVRADDVDAYH